MKIAKTSRVLLIGPDNIPHIARAEKPYHTNFGMVDLPKLIGKEFGAHIKSNTGEQFVVLEPRFHDLLLKTKRGPQVVLLKDAAVIAAYAGLTNGNFIVDAGAGSGWLASFMANAVAPDGKVVSYEWKEGFAELARENIALLGLKNVEIKIKDVYKGISERNVDLITLDLPEPWKAVKHAEKALKPGGYLVAYLPTIMQIVEFSQKLTKKFVQEQVLEVIEQDWIVKGKIVRPEQQQLVHTGFILFARKIG